MKKMLCRFKSMSASEIFASIIKKIGFMCLGMGFALIMENICVGYAGVLVGLSILDIAGAYAIKLLDYCEDEEEEDND